MRLVIKTGSAVLSKEVGGLDTSSVARLAAQLTKAYKAGHEIVLITSGAIAAGVAKLGWTERPADLPLKQAAASVGQVALMQAYQDAFSKDNIIAAQVLLTRDDLMSKERYLNIRNALLHLISLKVIPIINENDCVSTEEIQFGDNDTLSAVVATKVQADKLILLSDVPGLFEQDGEGKLTSTVIPVVERVTPEMEGKAVKKKGSKMSVGGIITKLRAARMATAAGVETWLTSGYDPDAIEKILSGAATAGTCFVAQKGSKIKSRELWIAFGRQPKGSVVIDDGALTAVQQGKSLLASGIRRLTGNFNVGDMVAVKSLTGGEVARGLINFSSTDVKQIQVITAKKSRPSWAARLRTK